MHSWAYTMDWGRKWLVDFNAGRTQFILFDCSNNTGATDVKMDGSVLEGKSSFKTLRLSFSSELDLCSETASKKIGALIHSRKFFSPEVTLYLYRSTIQPCIEYYSHV